MNIREPRINEIIVVPLAHPNGAYIKLNNGSRVPVLAKVRTKFGETVNVINYFGYIYNVPFSNTEPVDNYRQTQFYVNMVEQAGQVLNHLGYEMLDNSEFHATIMPSTYTFIEQLPGYDIIPLSPYSSDNIVYQIESPVLQPQYVYDTMNSPNNIPNIIYTSHHDNKDDTYDEYDYIGNIIVTNIHDEGVLHIIDNSQSNIIFDDNTGELLIKGYGYFIIQKSYVYKNSSNKSFVIFQSHNNFIHIRKKYVKYEKISKTDKSSSDINDKYKINVIKLKRSNSKHKKYYNIISIIDQKLE